MASVLGETWLAEVFSTTVEPDLFMNADLRIGIDMLIGEDRRERAMREIALRRGQPAFRSALLHAYKKTCAVTGFNTERVLEAAHISPYLGLHTNSVTNGLLLRADIHTLFDLSLLTVTRDYRVHVAPELADTPYSQLNLRQLVVIPGSGLASIRDCWRTTTATASGLPSGVWRHGGGLLPPVGGCNSSDTPRGGPLPRSSDKLTPRPRRRGRQCTRGFTRVC